MLNAKNCPFVPLDDALIVRKIVETTTAGGIALPNSNKDMHGKFVVKAEIIAAGPGRLVADGPLAGKSLPMTVKPGDVVLVVGTAGLSMEEALRMEVGLSAEDADSINLMRLTDVVCKITPKA